MKKDLLQLLDLSQAEIIKILNESDQMKYNQQHGLTHNCLQGKTLALLFAADAPRVRTLFETGMFQMGGNAIALIGAQGEPLEDSVRALARYCDGIVLCMEDHAQAERAAKYAAVPVLNGGTLFSAPLQALADLMTMREYLSRLEGTKLCYLGACGGRANALIVGALKCGMTVSAVSDAAHEPDPRVPAFAAESAAGRFTLSQAPETAIADAHVVCLDAGACYPLTDALLAGARADCLVLHGLPAHRGEEITAEIFEAHATELFDAAENHLHIQKAVLSLLLGEARR